VREAIHECRWLGQIVTPAAGNAVMGGASAPWCADNAVFADKYPGDMEYLSWLAQRLWAAQWCRFAVAPDVVGDAVATLARSAPMLGVIRTWGFPVALALQDGVENLAIPWSEFDVAFIGGSTEWKIGEAARELSAETKARGKWLHMGRVNTLERLRIAASFGCDSVDGTYLAFGPDINLPKLLGWLAEVNAERIQR
jgi:hypothetical protein